MSQPNSSVQDISERLAAEFHRLVPQQPSNVKGGRPSVEQLQSKYENALKAFYELAHQERLQHRLGVIGRARVAFALQQRLLEAGYPSSLVKQVLFAMLTSAFVGERKH